MKGTTTIAHVLGNLTLSNHDRIFFLAFETAIGHSWAENAFWVQGGAGVYVCVQ